MTCRSPEINSAKFCGEIRLIAVLQVLLAERATLYEGADLDGGASILQESSSHCAQVRAHRDRANEKGLRLESVLHSTSADLTFLAQAQRPGRPGRRTTNSHHCAWAPACVCLARLNWILTGLLIYINSHLLTDEDAFRT